MTAVDAADINAAMGSQKYNRLPMLGIITKVQSILRFNLRFLSTYLWQQRVCWYDLSINQYRLFHINVPIVSLAIYLN